MENQNISMLCLRKTWSVILVDIAYPAQHQLLSCVSHAKSVFVTDVTEMEIVLLFFLNEMKGWQSEAGRLIKGHGEGQSWSRSCSCCTCMHYHSFTVCHPPLFCHSLSLFLPPTFPFHPRPTFLVVVGVAIRHGAQREKHKAKVGQILHAAQITLEDCTLSQVDSAAHSCCTSSLLCASDGAPCAPTSAQLACFSFQTVLAQTQTHTNTRKHMRALALVHLFVNQYPLGQFVSNLH